MDRPTIITLFDTDQHSEWKSVKRLYNYIHLNKLFKTGGVTIADSLTDLELKVKAYLENPSLHRELRNEAVQRECFRNDGKATDRFVNNVTKILT